MKALHICPDYLGTAVYENLFSSLQTVGIDSEVFTLIHKNKITNGESVGNLKIWDKQFSLIDRIIYFRKQRDIYKKICKEFSINDFKIVHAHTLFSAGFSAYLLSKKYGLPYIVALRNTDVNVFFRYMFHLRNLGRSIMYEAQSIIFISPSYRDFVLDIYIPNGNRQKIFDKSFVIPNGIDKFFLDNKFFAKRKIDKNLIKLIYFGEISANKNIETTIKSCKLLLEKGFSVKFTIVGEILDPKYKTIFANYPFIDSYPKCPKEQIILHLRCSDIFVMPSVYETFGLVYAEAMSQGLPIIYSKGQGFDGQFENSVVGYAVNCYDFRDIAQKVIDLYSNYQQVSERCVSLVDKFNWLSIAKEYKRLYEK